MRRVWMSLRYVRYRCKYMSSCVHVWAFVRCALTSTWAMSECSQLVQYGSWAGLVIMRSRILCSRVLVCTNEFMYENQYLSTVLAPQGFVLLCTSVQCEPSRASYSVLVLAPQGFVLLCTSVRCEPNGVCAVRTNKGFVLRCTVRAPRGLCGASLQRL